MKINFYFIIFILFIFSCSNKEITYYSDREDYLEQQQGFNVLPQASLKNEIFLQRKYTENRVEINEIIYEDNSYSSLNEAMLELARQKIAPDGYILDAIMNIEKEEGNWSTTDIDGKSVLEREIVVRHADAITYPQITNREDFQEEITDEDMAETIEEDPENNEEYNEYEEIIEEDAEPSEVETNEDQDIDNTEEINEEEINESQEIIEE